LQTNLSRDNNQIKRSLSKLNLNRSKTSKICRGGFTILILQNDTMNQYGQLAISIPFRPGIKQAPYVVNVAASSINGLDKDRFLDVDQIRSIDGQRVLGLVGILEDNYWQQIQDALSIVSGFGLV
jgi:mRNA interferase MazF